MFRSASNTLGVDGVVFGSAQGLVATPPDAVGKIQTTIGPVTVMRAGGVVARVDVGEFVYQGDAIATGADGAVGIIFADGTVFNLSSDARAVLNEFAYDPNGNSNSALLSLAQGKFAFIAGKVAKTGGLRIDTPFASIRGSARDRGVGVLTLAALTFAAIEESQAASRHDAFLDDGTITYKDLPHGTFEIVTRDGRVIMSDDPGETIVVDPTGAVTRIPNSSSRMAELQQAQHSALATLSLGQEGGAAGGSSSPGFDIPVQLQPINFSPPRNDAPTDLVTTHITAASSGFIPELKPPEPKPPLPALGFAGFSMVTETVNTTGSTHLDTVSSGTLTFTDFKLTTVSATMASMTWSGGATPPSGLAEVLAGALSITTENADPVSGSITTTFGAADHNFDFLAANETLTIVYDVTATDNSGVSLTRPVTITITGTNDAPVLAADASGPHTVTEGLNTTGTFVFTDVDLTDHHTVSMSVTSATWSGGATLPSGVAAALAGALSATVSDGTGPGSGSVAVTFSAADSAFDFLAAGQTLKITYNVTLADNSGVSSSQPVTITVTGTDDAPVLTVAAIASYSENAAPVTLSPAATVNDVDNQTLQSATVSISSGLLTGDVLAATTAGTGITASYNAASGVLTLTGNDTLAHYQQVLDSVTYVSTSDNPTNFGTQTSRTISWVINDGALNNGTTQTTSLSIVAADDAPVLSNVAASASYPEQAPAVTLSPIATVSDVDNQTLQSARVSISSGLLTGDVLAATTAGTGITASYNAASGVLTLTGNDTLAHYQQVLDSVTYVSTSDNPTNFGTQTSRTISWVINDGALNNGTTQTTTLSIVASDNAPVLSNVAASASYSENAAPLTLSPAAAVSDVDNQTLQSATVSISSGLFTGDVLAATTAGTGITASYNAASGVLTLTGNDTLAHYQQVLDSVTYASTSDNPTNFGTDTSRTISWVVNDGTLNNSTIQTTALSITGTDDAPVLTVAATASYSENAAPVTLSPAATVNDVDNQTLQSATVSISSGLFTGDVLAATTAGTGITASYNAASGVLTLTGNDTLAHYQQVLDSVTYVSTSDNPTNFGTDTSRTISWVVNDGTLNNSTIQTTALSITGTDDAPVLTVAATASYSENAAPLTLSPAAAVSDVDNQTLQSATVSISSGLFTGDVLAATTAGTGITASYNAASGVLTLTGNDTLAHYQQVLDSVTYASTSDNPTNFGTDTSRTISWVVNDGTLNNSTIQTTALSITGTDDAPVLTVAASASYSENAAPVTLSSAAAVSDVDNQTLAFASVSISSGLFAGDVLAATTAGTGITANYNAASGVLTLTGNDTLAHYQQVLDSVTYVSTSDNPTNFGTQTSRTISWVINDGALNNGTTQTTSLSIVAADDAPVLSNVAASASYPEQAPAVTLSPIAAVSDVDNQTLQSATVSISSGLLTGDVLAATTAGTGITASYNAASGVLTLTGNDTLAHYQQVLDSVTYVSTSDNPTNFGTQTSRTISWVINDGALNNGTTQTTTLSIVASDNAPVLSNVAATASYSENAAPLTLSPAAAVSDVDNQTLQSATVSISSGLFTGDVLAATTAGTGITASYNAASGVLTLTGNDTLAHYQQVLDSVTYASTSDNPTNFGTDTSRTISWVVNDGTLNNSTIQTTTLSIVAADDAPVLSNVAATASYSENAAPVTLSPAAAVSDVDNQTLQSARVSISSGLLTGDVLAATTAGTGITASYNAASGVLTLTGNDTLAHYQQVLDSVTYASTSDNPTNFGTDTSRTISWVVNDGTLNNSTIQTTALSIVAADDAPVLTVAATASYSENAAPLTLSPAAAVSDVDNQTLQSATVSISSGLLTGDVLAATTAGTGITASYNAASGVLTLTGNDTLAHYQQVLDSVTYASTSDNPTNFGTDTSRTISWVVNDGTLNNSTIQTTALSITGTDDAPVLTVAASASYSENAAPVTLSSAAAVSDVDNQTLAFASVSISSGLFAGDVLAATTAGTGITANYNAASGVLTLTGNDTLAHYQQVLDSVTYVSTSDNPTNFGTQTSRTISWVINDGALNNGTTQTTSLSIVAADDAPVLSNVAASASYPEQAPAVTLSPIATVSDVDNQTLQSARVSISSGLLTGDVLAATTAGTGITASYNAASGVLTLTGNDTLAHYQQVLDSVTYVSTSDNPTNFGTQTSRTISWVINDGALNNGTTQTTTLSIVASDNAPVLSNVAASASYSENAAPLTLSPAAAVSDVDNQTLQSATVSISSGLFTGDVLAATTAGTGITASYNAASGVLTLTGNDTLAHYQQVLDSVTYASTSDNPTNFGTDTSRTISWVVNDGTLNNSTIQTTALSITGTDDAPVLTVAATASYSENAAPVTLSPAATVNDVDNQTLQSATVSISSGLFTGDVLAATTAGTGITASYNAASGVLTLTGNDTLAHYQQVLDSVTYVSTSDNPTNFGTDTSRTISWVVNDGTLNSTKSTTLAITAVNDAPVATIVPTTYSAAGSLNLKNTGMSVSDIDSLGGVETVRLSVTEGTLTVTAGTSGAAVSGNGTSTVTITGTLAQINALLNTDATSTVSYIDNLSPPSASATLTLSINDNGNTGTGGALTSSDTATINIAFFIAPGTVLDLKGGTLPNPLIENDGTIRTGSNNTSTILGSITGTGGIELTNNTTLIINGPVGSGQTVLFTVDPGGGANAKLVLNDPLNFHAKISDFSGNDQIDLGNFVVSSITYVDNAGTNTGGTLKIFGIFNGNGIVTEVDLIFVDGDKTTPNFTFASDGNNGTTIVDPPTSTMTLEATVIPVVDRLTLTATTADTQTNTTSVAVDDGTVVASSACTDSLDGADAARLLTINGAGAVDHGSLTLNGALTLDAGAFQLAIKQQRKRDNADGRHSDRANGDLQAASIGIGAAVLFLIEHGNCTIAEAATYDGSSIAENDAAGTLSNSDAALKFNTIARPISGALADGGTVEVAGGRLEMADTASAMGVLKIDAGATLQFDGDRAVNVTLAGSTGELGSTWTFSDHAHGGAVVAHQNTGNHGPAATFADSTGELGSTWTFSDHAHGGAVVAHQNTDNHGPAAQSPDLSSQAASHAPSEIPLATSNNGANSLLLPISAPNREPGNAASPASEFATNHLHPADANTGNHGLEPQSLEPSSQAALQTPLEIPPAPSDNGATNLSNSFNSPALPTAANDIASQAAQDRGPPGAALAADHGKDSNSGHDGVGDSHAANKIHPDHSSPALPSAANDSASQAAQDRGPPGAALAADHGKDSNSGHDGVGESHAANKIPSDHSSPALPSAANDSASQAAQDRGPPGAALAADHGKDSNSGHDGVGESHAANKIPSDHSSPALPSAANDSASQAAQDRGPPGAALAADHGKDSNSGHDGIGESHDGNKAQLDQPSPVLATVANDVSPQADQDPGPPGAAAVGEHGKDSNSGHDGVGESPAGNKMHSDLSSPALPSAATDSAPQAAAQTPGPPGGAAVGEHGKDSNSGHDGIGESHAGNKAQFDQPSPVLATAANDIAPQAAQDSGPPGAAPGGDHGKDSSSGHDGIGESPAGNKAQFDHSSPALATVANDVSPQSAHDRGPPGASPVGNPGKDQFAFDSHFGHDGESPAGNTTQFDQPSPALTTAANDSAAQAGQNPAPLSAAPDGDHAKDQFAFDSNFGHDGESPAGNTTQFDQPSPALTTAANDSAAQAGQNQAPLSAALAGDHAKDQFAFDSNFGHDGIGESHAGNTPQPDQQIFQTVSDILAHTAEAHSAQAVAADGQNHDAALTPVQKDKPLSDFIIHA